MFAQLELKVPPPAVALVVALGMWGLAPAGPPWPLPPAARESAALLFACAGAAFDAPALLAFLRARTSINPFSPHRTSALVTTGIYRLTRNPMYVGLALFLVSWATWLASPWPFIGPLVFVAYITRFQILPEERALRRAFGEEYAAYTRRVKRWL